VDALSRPVDPWWRASRINPAVDSYNFVSVTFGTPAGAYNLDKIDRIDGR